VLALSCLAVAAAAAAVPQINICDGANCPSVSRVGMGTLHLGDKISGLSDPAEINAWIQSAVALGIDLFDLADVYPVKGGDEGSSAELFGQALALTPGLREQIKIVAKMDIIFPTAIDTSRAHLEQTLNWFLDVLQTTYVDILLLHYSNSFMNASEVSEFFRDSKKDGKVLHFGVSNHYPSKFDLLQKKLDAVTSGDIRLVTHEFECSVWNPSYLNYNSPVADHAYQNGVHPLAWGSLGGDPIGGLNRLFVRRGDRQSKIQRKLSSVGKEMGISDNTVVALVWLMSHPVGFIPLLGTTNVKHMQTQVTAFDFLGRMTNDQWWSIGAAGGLCAMGDSQCNYSEYMARDSEDDKGRDTDDAVE
jgi:predicted oxidoreductase